MADPLSIAGLAVSVLQVSAEIFQYVSAVKNAKDDIRRLSHEMFALKGTLDHMVAFQQFNVQDARDAPQMEAVILMTSETLATIKKRIARRSTGIGKSVQLLTWPFHKGDIDKYVATLERAKTWFMMYLMQDSSDQTSAVYAEVRRLSDMIHEDIISRQLDRMTLEAEDTIRSLSPVNPAEDHLRVRRDLIPSTGQWFMDKAFEAWAEMVPSDSRPILWVKGKSGAGKSSLFSSVVEELRDRCSRLNRSACCYFYCHSGNTASQLPVNVLGALLAQLCQLRPDLLSEVRPLLKSDNHLIPQSQLSIPDLARLLHSALEPLPRCYVLVDALNETPHNRQIVSLLGNLCHTCPNLRVLVTSTSDPHVKGKQILVRQLSIDDIDHDIGVYVDHRLKTEPSFSGLSERIKMEIKLTIATGAHGMFRWAQLGMDRLCNLRTGRDVLLALNDLPSNLNDTYAMLLRRIPNHDYNIARNAFMWLSFSIKRLSLRQLAEAVVLEETDRDLNDDYRLTDPASIIEICQGLIQLEDGFVTLAHDSIRACLMSDWIRKSSVAEFWLEPGASHRTIMRKCLAYLSFDVFAKGHIEGSREYVRRCRRYPLVEYAAICWPDHAANTILEKEDEQLILDFFRTKALPKGGNFNAWVQALLGTVDTGSIERTQPLYYAASYNMVPIVKLLLRQGSDVDVNKPGGRFGSTPFAIACYRGHSEVAKLLLEAGADPSVRDAGTGTRALTMAQMRDMDEVVEMIEKHPTMGRRQAESASDPWWGDEESRMRKRQLQRRLLQLTVQLHSITFQKDEALLAQMRKEMKTIEAELRPLREEYEGEEEESEHDG
ncbi:ankyrin repeat protein [Coniochaeta sp. 2T2.1]|nr:ankyrin repeat protein [Coniochaeta sp. 2T2.1]